ncbi:serine/threonine-protein kinase [Ruminococcus flavefaciens]|uniref:serine/threonine-protein kinase n=1 Tax=Ruminococcus flavefaciens TaxID=1265 RepID=UPI00046486FB|nr:serine/threonine-protein kinase [Ruminococcus flavefaciens]
MNIDVIIEDVLQQIPQPLWENWYIKGRIGSGGFSVVYRVEAERTKRVDVAALKIEPILPDERFADDEERSLLFLKQKRAEIEEESAIMYKLRNCPNIVSYEEETVKEFIKNGKLSGYIFLIRMELLQNVYEIMTSRQLNTDEANVIRLAKEIGNGLKAAHDIGVIHRDVKPSNFFISKNRTYKLGDFNIAKQTSYTRSFAGTEGYIAPEVYSAKSGYASAYSAQADIYSLGICLYQFMNNGLFPFEDTVLTEEAIDKRMSGEELPPPSNASDSFSKIILKACAYEADTRYANMSEMLADLDKLNAPKVDAYVSGSGFAATKSPATVYAGNTSYSAGNETKYADSSAFMQTQAVEASRNSRKKTIITVSVIIALIVVLGGLLFFAASISKDKKHDDKAVFSEVTGTSLTTVTTPLTTDESTLDATTATTSATSRSTSTAETTTTEIITTTATPVYGTGWDFEGDYDLDGDGVSEHIEVYKDKLINYNMNNGARYRIYKSTDNFKDISIPIEKTDKHCDYLVFDANTNQYMLCHIRLEEITGLESYNILSLTSKFYADIAQINDTCDNYNNITSDEYSRYGQDGSILGKFKNSYYINGQNYNQPAALNYLNNLHVIYTLGGMDYWNSMMSLANN